MTPPVEKTPPPVAQTAPGGNGKVSDLPSAFADAVIAAIRREEGRTADPLVAAAVGLGWYLAALAHAGEVTLTAAATRGDLAALAGADVVLDYCRDQVKVGVAKLEDLIASAHLALPDLDGLASDDGDVRRAAAAEAGGRLLSALCAADFRIGKAFAVGRGLLDVTTRPADDATLKEHVTAVRIAPVVAAIDDLSSALPAHAGHSVRASLLEWHASFEVPPPPGCEHVAPESEKTWLLLARQGELYRALLSGEKSGPDMLEIEDYVDAAERLSRRMREVLRRFVWQFKWLALALAVLVAGAVALVVVTDSTAAIVAFAGSALASLGLTWRGAGRGLGGLSARLERPLWGAELDTSITQAITLLPRQQGRDISEQRRAVAVALGSQHDR